MDFGFSYEQASTCLYEEWPSWIPNNAKTINPLKSNTLPSEHTEPYIFHSGLDFTKTNTLKSLKKHVNNINAKVYWSASGIFPGGQNLERTIEIEKNEHLYKIK